MKAALVRAAIVAGFALALGCTFGGLADYDTPECDPTLPRSKDPCAALDTDPSACPVHRCSARTRHCTAAREAETCDGVDDDCSGTRDEDLLAPRAAASLASVPADATDVTLATGGNAGDLYAAYATGGCVKGALSPAGGAPATPLDLACDSAVALHQPTIAPLFTSSKPTIAVAAIAVDASCSAGTVTFGADSSRRVAVSGCGASLPALASLAGGDQAVVAWYDAPLGDRSDPAAACAGAHPAALRVRWIERAASAEAVPTVSATATTSSASIAPPALLALPEADYALLASPSDGGVRAWALGKNVQGHPLFVPLLADPIADTGDARAVALALGGPHASPRLAVAVTQGCGAAQRVSLFLAAFDPKTTRTTPLGTFAVAGSGEGGLAPTVAWVDSRAEWWVSWRGASGTLQLRRFSADGRAAGAAVDLGPGLVARARGDEGARFGSSVLVVTPQAVAESGLACP